MKSITIITLFLNMVCCFSLLAQRQDLTLPPVSWQQLSPSPIENKKPTVTIDFSDHELKTTLKLIFNVYKSFFSSQDGNTCTFYPSCSTYSMMAIQKRGLIMGSFAAFDRLSRCHGLATEQYELDKLSGKQIDKP